MSHFEIVVYSVHSVRNKIKATSNKPQRKEEANDVISYYLFDNTLKPFTNNHHKNHGHYTMLIYTYVCIISAQCDHITYHISTHHTDIIRVEQILL